MKNITVETNKGLVNCPCFDVIMADIDKVQANNYNPNSVPENNMKLLEQSIIDNGMCFPVVTIWSEEEEKYIIVDGFHRYSIFKDYLKAKQLPIVVLQQDIKQRMAATVQFNRARGVHQVELMGDLVKGLVEQGMGEDDIAEHLGMQLEEVFRLKQITGVAELFKKQLYSPAWEMKDMENNIYYDEKENEMANWEYGELYKKYNMDGIIKAGTGLVKVHNIFDPLPPMMLQADCVFCDPPCSKANINSFYTKADRTDYQESYEPFAERFFECLDEIAPDTVFIEVFAANHDFFLEQCKARFEYVKEYNTTYYHKAECKCWIIQASHISNATYPFEGKDEEDVIEYICKRVPYQCIGDLCMGRGLVGFYANKYGRYFVGTELNKKRLAVLLERITTGKLK